MDNQQSTIQAPQRRKRQYQADHEAHNNENKELKKLLGGFKSVNDKLRQQNNNLVNQNKQLRILLNEFESDLSKSQHEIAYLQGLLRNYSKTFGDLTESSPIRDQNHDKNNRCITCFQSSIDTTSGMQHRKKGVKSKIESEQGHEQNPSRISIGALISS
ncbi:hypothetical protein H2198_009334 [Neophaeococcomyces mojaviensis]|uniref:Uncharacterized protein n=1 Tax=Neophaeococcomyces mojaviensis TaxID=3383035 RepID=A0ACC2ZVC3_9EURO|nr:hypothetical protein H2198_009334 [Knufia sp. JES_112]